MLPTPTVNEIKGPSGIDTAAIFGDRLTLTYWDLWCLLAAQKCHDGRLYKLKRALIDQRLQESFWGIHKQELVEDLIALVTDLEERLSDLADPEEVLSHIPERLIKKESAKAVRNILEQYSYYPPSEPMLQSPRRKLEREAYRGMWPDLPVDPTPFADSLRPLFIPPEKEGHFPKGKTFALNKRIEKAVGKELAKAAKSSHPEACKYAVYRAAITLFHEQHHWDDSYGVMGELGEDWIDALLAMTPNSAGIEANIFLKDMLTFFCWENYGLSYAEDIAVLVHGRPQEEQQLAIAILKDIETRASDAFQKYHADNAQKILDKLNPSTPPKPKILRLVEDSQPC